MKHMIFGYGYSGFHLAKKLLQANDSVKAFARSPTPLYPLPGLDYQTFDCRQGTNIDVNDAILYYLIPPEPGAQTDTLLAAFIEKLKGRPRRAYYFSSSGVYGDHHGEWVNEHSPCHIQFDRQQRRLNAEKQWQDYCHRQHVDYVGLRISGIYGPDRIPIQAVINQQPVIIAEEAPLSNHIYVSDLANIIFELNAVDVQSICLNIADGEPRPMGSMQQQLSKIMKRPAADYCTFDVVWEQSSAMKKEFLASSKRLDIQLLLALLKGRIKLTPMHTALEQSFMESK